MFDFKDYLGELLEPSEYTKVASLNREMRDAIDLLHEETIQRANSLSRKETFREIVLYNRVKILSLFCIYFMILAGISKTTDLSIYMFLNYVSEFIVIYTAISTYFEYRAVLFLVDNLKTLGKEDVLEVATEYLDSLDENAPIIYPLLQDTVDNCISTFSKSILELVENKETEDIAGLFDFEVYNEGTTYYALKNYGDDEILNLTLTYTLITLLDKRGFEINKK